jgi:rhodanese-related sulfurtransferase
MRQLILMAGMVFVLLSTAYASADKGYKDIDAAGTRALMGNADALVVFPLSPIEFDHQHIEGSVNIVMDRLEYELPEDKERILVFYCLGIKCVASWRAAEKAVELGYKNVYTFREGIPGWQAAGYPLSSVNPLPDVVVKQITTVDLADMLDNEEVILLDINLREDAQKFHIDHAKRVHIPLDELNVSLPQLPREKKIVIICLKGKRAPTAAKYLIGQGYEDVVIVEGGIQQWVLEGRPVKRIG